MQHSCSRHEGSPVAGRQKNYLEGAILAVDAVGYSRLMGKDEEATLRRLHNYRALTQKLAM